MTSANVPAVSGPDVEALPPVAGSPSAGTRAGLGVGRHRPARSRRRSGSATRPVASRRRHCVDLLGLAPASRRRRCPARARNVNAIAPPMSSVSQRSSSASITPSLSLTLAPPSTATNGRVGVVGQQPRQHLDLAVQQPARRRRQHRAAGPTIEACARCDGTERVVRRRRRPARRGWRRTRGRSLSRPGRSAGSRAAPRRPGSTTPTSGSTRGPTTAGASGTSRAEQLAQPRARPAPSSTAGRPCPSAGRGAPHDHDDRVALAQPLDRRQRGGDAQVVVDHAVAQRHVEVGAHEDPLPRRQRAGPPGAGGPSASSTVGRLFRRRRRRGRRGGSSSPTRCRTSRAP